METARIAGCVFAVLRSSSSGPSKSSCSSPPPSAASASSSTARASGYACASACPIPTAWEPCPGKTNATGIYPPALPLEQRAAPGHAAADGHHQHQVAVLEPSGAVRLIERERNRSGGGVPHLLDVLLALLQRDLQLPHHVLEDAQVGLVGNHPVDVGRPVAVALQRLAGAPSGPSRRGCTGRRWRGRRASRRTRPTRRRPRPWSPRSSIGRSRRPRGKACRRSPCRR